MTPPSTALPAATSLDVLATTRRAGRVLVGGDPATVISLSDEAWACVDAFRAGRSVADVGADHGALAERVARRLLSTGMANPRPPTQDAPATSDVAVVIPAHNGAPTLPALFASLPADVAEVIVVDDGSTDATATVAREHGAKVIDHPVARGPAAARNAGLRAAAAPVVLFVDADTQLDPGAIDRLRNHLADAAVAAVAPRIVALDHEAAEEGGRLQRWVAAHDAARSPFDQGPSPARVAYGGRVPFMPSGALLVRRDVVNDKDGFDESMPLGEDVDLTWRLLDDGWTLRYEPAAVVRHRHRVRPDDVVRRRFLYGTSGGLVARRHPEAIAALTVDAGALSTGRLTTAGMPLPEAAKHVVRAQVRQVRATLFAITRPWLPVTLALALVSKRARAGLTLAVIARHSFEWRRLRPAMGLPAWIAIRTLDDASSAAGLWWGALKERTAAPLALRVRQPVEIERLQ